MSLSLQSSIRTCDVDVGEASRIQSDRFFNPYNMVCIPWNGVNNKGQEVCPDSFWTKTAGCDSALDRVLVESAQRPRYMSYVTLGAQGIDAPIYGNEMAYTESIAQNKWDMDRNKVTGNFGLQWSAQTDYTGCSVGAYETAMAQVNQSMRQQGALQNGYNAWSNGKSCGF